MNKKDLKIIMKILEAQIHLHEAVTDLTNKCKATEPLENLSSSLEHIRMALTMISEEASSHD